MKRFAVRASQDIARRSFAVTWDQNACLFFTFASFVFFVVNNPGEGRSVYRRVAAASVLEPSAGEMLVETALSLLREAATNTRSLVRRLALSRQPL